MIRVLGIFSLFWATLALADPVQRCLDISNHQEKIACLEGLNFTDFSANQALQATYQLLDHLAKLLKARIYWR